MLRSRISLPRNRNRRRPNEENKNEVNGGDGRLLVDDQEKYRKFRIRALSTLWMIAGFIFILYMGHMYIWGMIVVIQIFMARELFALAAKAQKEKVPGFRLLNWHFFFTAMIYVYGRFLTRQLVSSISTDKLLTLIFSGLIKYHMLISYFLYIAGFVWFILTLRKGKYQYQFGQYAWTHMILFVVFTQSSFTVANIFEGIIWFLLPASLIVINDIAAYICGFFFGRTPLIKLSPKKTWEGFIGASMVTMLSALVLAYYMGQFQWLTCPRKDLSNVPLHCDPGALFKPRHVSLHGWVPSWFPRQEWTIMPVQKHALAYGLFASIIAPFGGFFASGFKRAFKIKDFGDSIPGHGGITDRMDCQMVMAVFSYIYYQSFIAPLNITVDDVMEQILQTLSMEQQLDLYKELGEVLSKRLAALA